MKVLLYRWICSTWRRWNCDNKCHRGFVESVKKTTLRRLSVTNVGKDNRCLCLGETVWRERYLSDFSRTGDNWQMFAFLHLSYILGLTKLNLILTENPGPSKDSLITCEEKDIGKFTRITQTFPPQLCGHTCSRGIGESPRSFVWGERFQHSLIDNRPQYQHRLPLAPFSGLVLLKIAFFWVGGLLLGMLAMTHLLWVALVAQRLWESTLVRR